MARVPYHDTISPSTSVTVHVRTEQATCLLGVLLAEAIGFGRQQHPCNARPVDGFFVDHGITGFLDRGPGLPADGFQHGGDPGTAGHRHPRPAPDRIEHALRRQGGGDRAREFQHRFEGLHGVVRRLLAVEHPAEQAKERDVVFQAAGVGDDHLDAGRGDRLDLFAPVLVDVGDDVRRLEGEETFEPHVLGPSHLRHPFTRRDGRKNRCAPPPPRPD